MFFNVFYSHIHVFYNYETDRQTITDRQTGGNAISVTERLLHNGR